MSEIEDWQIIDCADELLHRLLRNGEANGRSLTLASVSMECVLQAVSYLTELGLPIETTGELTYELNTFTIEHWESYLTVRFKHYGLDKPIKVFRETASTQDIARNFTPGPALIITDHQTAGRGRLGRQWISEPGAGIIFTLVWPKANCNATPDRVAIAAGLGVAQGLSSGSLDMQLKWPNDIVYQGRKLAGILIESTEDAYLIGVGVNYSSTPEIKGQTDLAAVSMREIHDWLHEQERLPKLAHIVNRLESWLDQAGNDERIREGWEERAIAGQTQTFENNNQRITGEVLDLDPDHGLIVRRDTGEIVTLPAATTSVVK